jgi:hypothetical protein
MPGGPRGPASQVVPDLPYEQYGQQGPECEPGAYGPLVGHLPFDLFAGGPVEVSGGEPGRAQKGRYRKPSWVSADCKDCWKPALV